MGFRRSFLIGLFTWVGLVLLTAFLFVLALLQDGLAAARLVAALACLGAVAGLWRHVQRTNLELARFVDAVRFGDLSQNFSASGQGSGFGEVAGALNDAVRKLRDERHQLTDANRFYEAVLDDAPTALLVIDGDGRVELGNKAARRLLIKHRGVRVDDFREYGDAFARSLGDSSVGRPRLVPLVVDGVAQTVMVSAAVVHRLGGLARVVAVQPIQSELNMVEIAAQSDLIRVLTHEIMNSMTPVTSLAHTAADLVARAEGGDPRDLADARVAVETLAGRADGLMHFVETYRQISRAPKVHLRTFAAGPWVDSIAALFRASDIPANLAFEHAVAPPDLTIDCDPDLLAQVLINLLKNAADAASRHSETPSVSLEVSLARSGKTSIAVSDNGPGVPEALSQDVFLPFFTTREQGTGVGLSLARQIVLAHHGSIGVQRNAAGGAVFLVVL